jgi:hypothetical protein
MESIEILKGILRDPFNGEIYEGLIKTVELDQAFNILNKQFSHLSGFTLSKDENTITLGFKPRYVGYELAKMISGNLYDHDISEVLKYTNNLGYIPSYFIYVSYKIKSQKWNPSEFRKIIYEIEPEYISFRFEKKYDDVVDPPNIIYHITNKDFLKNIEKIGLKPKNLNKRSSHPEKIYFSLTRGGSDNLWKNLKLNYGKGEGILLTVDASNLLNTFYKDPNSKESIYTYNNIPKENIIKIEPIIEV